MIPMLQHSVLGCPVCKARFRGHKACPRCGADLSRLMFVVACAHRLRSRARQALCEGRYRDAQALAAEAQNLHGTPRGHKLERIARLLDMVSIRR